MSLDIWSSWSEPFAPGYLSSLAASRAVLSLRLVFWSCVGLVCAV